MIQQEINGYKLELFNSIDEISIKRFHAFQKYVLIDSGVGSSIEDVNDKLLRVGRYLDMQRIDLARIELENMRQGIYLILNELNPSHLAFAVMIHKIDGEEVTDISDDNLKNILAKLERTPKGLVNKLMEAFKKKVDKELNLYFPGQFNTAAAKEYMQRIKRKALLQLDEILRGNDNGDSIKEIDDSLMLLAKPELFSGKQSAELKHERNFTRLCLFLQQQLPHTKVQDMTVRDFFESVKFLKDQKKIKK